MRYLVLILTLVATCTASEGPPPVLNIKTYTSASGHYALTVDPSRLHGGGPGSYRMLHDGKEAWAKDLDFTLWDARIADDGTVAGYAYTTGWRGIDFDTHARGNGEFVIAILNPDGSPRLEKTVPRTDSRAFDTPPDPLALGCFIANGRLVLRFREETNDMMKQGERWETYDIGKGTQEAVTLPSPKIAGQGFAMVIGAHAVQGTNLILVSHAVFSFGAARHEGLRLSLVDKSCHELWSKEWPDEFSKIENFGAWSVEPDELSPTQGLKPGEFIVRSIADQARITYTATHGADAWKVEETGSVPEAVVLRDSRRQTAKPEAQAITLEHRGSIALDCGGGNDEPALGVMDFAFDGAGRIGFISGAKEPFEFTLIDPDHPPAKKIPLAMSHDDKIAFPQTAWIGGDRWIIIRGNYEGKDPSPAFILNAADGTLTPVPAYNGPAPGLGQGLVGFGDRGFLVKGDYRSGNAVTRVSPDCKATWNFDAPDLRGMPQAVAPCPDGAVGVLVGISNQIGVFDEKGQHKQTISLEQTMGRRPNYVAGLAADENGGWILHDFNGSPPVYRLTAEGKIASKFTPHYADGRTFTLYGGVKRSPDGHLWTSDQASLLRLDNEGKVDRILGRRPEASSLSEIRCLTVDTRGIYAVDGHNFWVHVFDLSGTHRTILKPSPEDFPSGGGLGSIGISGDGSVYVRPDSIGLDKQGYLKFGPDGSRIGFQHGISEEVVDDWVFRPGSQDRLVLGYERAFMVGADGQKSRTIERRADRKWLERPEAASIAPDGSFAIVAGPSSWGWGGVESVTFFTPAGEAYRTQEVPGVRSARIAFDGKTAFVVSDEVVYILEAASGKIGAFDIPGGKKRQWWYPYCSPDGKELWLLDTEAKIIQRYARP